MDKKSPPRPPSDRALEVPAGDATLQADLRVPEKTRSLVLFAHGSGSSRRSPRNRRVAEALNAEGLATALVDLLTSTEETVDRITSQFRFDVDLIASRLIATIDWIGRQPELKEMRLGCFGASTGGAAALISAARRPDRVRAVVSRGGRVDLAGRWLAQVRAPTLLVVGAKDIDVLAINQHALGELQVEKRLEVIAGATHLFDEAGALEEVSRVAASWFTTFLS